MANAAKGEATATLADGTVLTLAFDFDGLAEAEEVGGKRISELLDDCRTGQPRLKTVKALVYGGLRLHHSDIDEKETGSLILANAQELTAAMMQALTNSFPVAEDGKEENPTPPKAPKAKRGTS